MNFVEKDNFLWIVFFVNKSIKLLSDFINIKDVFMYIDLILLISRNFLYIGIIILFKFA